MDIGSLSAPWTGVATYTWSLASALLRLGGDDEFWFATRGRAARVLPDLRWSATGEPSSPARLMVRRSRMFSSLARPIVEYADAVRISRAMAGAFPDVYFEPNIVLKHRIARRRVVTIHDLSFWNHPEWFPPEAVTLRARLARSLGEVDAIITGSWTVKNELCGELGLNSDLIHVIYHGVDHDVFTPDPGNRAGLPEGLTGVVGYILCAGSLEPRKNLLRLLDAYAMLDRTVRDRHHLVIAGFRGWRSEEVTRKVEELTPAVTYLGYVDRQELAALYRNSSLFVYPSLYEGFGLPPLEAMACGTPTLMSDIAVFREIFGEAALFCNTTRTESIAESLAGILDRPQALALARERGMALAQQFSWDESARAHLAVLHGVCR